MKNIITTILLLICLILGYFVFFGNSSNDYKKKLADLAASNKALELKRDSLNSDIKLLRIQFDSLQSKDSVLGIKVNKQDVEIAKDKAIAAKSQAELDCVKHGLEQTRRQIDSVKAHPANRTGNDLLNSLKIKK